MVLRSPQYFYVHNKFGKAQKQYIFTNFGGDQLSGRLASGLNMTDDTFALYHLTGIPHYMPTLKSVQLNEVIAGYCTLDSLFQVLVQYLVASVRFYAEWITSSYPSEHLIFNTSFWTNNNHIEYRHSIISGNFFYKISNMKVIGFSDLSRKMHHLEQNIEAISSNYNSPTSQSSSSIMPILISIQSQISCVFAETIEAVSVLHEKSVNDDPVFFFFFEITTGLITTK